jgi:AraC-like DNA-binding protein
LFEDFELANYSKWDVQGRTFNKIYHVDSINFKIKNIVGKYAAIPLFDTIVDIENQGKLISKPFIINRHYINFLIGGGEHETRECISLLINNKIVKNATGNNSNTLESVSWDVKDLEGQEAVIEIVDAVGSQWDKLLPYVIIDHINFTDKNQAEEFVFENFESGTYNNWNLEGEAFKLAGNRTNIYYPLSADGFNGKYFAFSFADTHDKKTGKLISKEFNINYDFISFLIGGGNHPNNTCLNLIINDSIVRSSTGRNSGKLRFEQWDVKIYKGKKAKLEIVDNVSGSWGHVMIDDIIFTNKNLIKNKKSNWITIWISISIFLLIVFIIIIKYRVKSDNTNINIEDKVKFEKIDELIQSNKLFLEKGLTPKTIAKHVDISDTRLLSLIKNFKFNSFTDYINYCKVEEFKREIQKEENQDYTLIFVAQNCGFSSKTSFYRIFKQHVGKTPSQYVKDLK